MDNSDLLNSRGGCSFQRIVQYRFVGDRDEVLVLCVGDRAETGTPASAGNKRFQRTLTTNGSVVCDLISSIIDANCDSSIDPFSCKPRCLRGHPEKVRHDFRSNFRLMRDRVLCRFPRATGPPAPSPGKSMQYCSGLFRLSA